MHIDFEEEEKGLVTLWLAGYSMKGLGRARAERSTMSEEFERGEAESIIRDTIKKKLKRKGAK